MATKIYASSAAPWEDGGSSIEQFESGLVRVMQNYLVPTADLSSYLKTFASGGELAGITSPAIDGLSIYPSPKFEDQKNGFTRISVSAYGRSTTAPNINLTYRRLFRVFDNTDYQFLVPHYEILVVLKEGENPDVINTTLLRWRDPVYVIGNTSYSPLSPSAILSALEFPISQGQTTNFGVYKEIAITAFHEPIAAIEEDDEI